MTKLKAFQLNLGPEQTSPSFQEASDELFPTLFVVIEDTPTTPPPPGIDVYEYIDIVLVFQYYAT